MAVHVAVEIVRPVRCAVPAAVRSWSGVWVAVRWMVCGPVRGEGWASDRRLTVERVEQRCTQFRLLDDHVGGEEMFALVTSEVAATADLLRLAKHAEDVGRRPLIALGELCQ